MTINVRKKPKSKKPAIKPAGQKPKKKTAIKRRPKSKKFTRGAGCPGVKMFKLEDINPAPYNPRQIDVEAMTGLMNSIKRFGYVEPIVVNVRNGGNVIVGGNQRFKALVALNHIECLCITVDCSEPDEKLLNLTLNNPMIQGGFIKNIVAYIEELRQELPNDKDFLKLRIADLQNELGHVPGKIGNVPDDDIPKIPKKTRARSGDLWVLGKHRLLCGDSTNAADVRRLMGGRKAELWATDPPYCVDYTGKNRPEGGRDWSEKFREIEIKDPRKFMLDYVKVGLRNIEKKTAIFLWHASKRRRVLEDVCAELDILIHQQIIWVKPCVVLGYSVYPWRHEPCALMWKRGSMPAFTKKAKSIGTVWPVGYVRTGDPTTAEYYSDVWELDYEGKKRPGDIGHPTVKPVEVFAIPMRVHTRVGGICYEPFCGSGSQIIAAEKLDRRCFAMESVPVFVDVAVKRWELWTGQTAKRQKK